MFKFKKISLILISCAYIVSASLQAQSEDSSGSAQIVSETNKPLNELIKPLPTQSEIDPQMVDLGRKLFHDKRLSGDDTISCASCHALSTGGVDNQVTSLGIHGQRGPINSPTVFNSGYNFVQFWDGRVATLEEQADGPVNNPLEMGSNWVQVLEKLNQDPEYLKTFDKLFNDGLSPENIQKAIADYERSLITPNSRFDQYLNGNPDAISAQEKSGYELFKSVGCITCHMGINVGGNMYQKMGLFGDYFADRDGKVTEADLGRYNVTKIEGQKHFFKVPSLRNIDKTAPYLHDGSQKTLENTVRLMAKYQLNKNLSEKEVSDIVAFLKTLTGEYILTKEELEQ
tara:strand:- start:46098 stop:47126 length:1029 start_codon:yes stop_codon:yes gene_type:complete